LTWLRFEEGTDRLLGGGFTVSSLQSGLSLFLFLFLLGYPRHDDVKNAYAWL
jgi:hypothetical protein